MSNFVWISHIYLDTQLHSTRFIQMARALVERGHVVRLVVPSLVTPVHRWWESFCETKYVPTIRSPYPASLSFAVMLFPFLINALRDGSQHVVITEYPSLPGGLGTLLQGCHKLILDVRSPPVERGLRGFLQRAQYYSSLVIAGHLCDGITVITPALKADICRRLRIDPSKVGVWTSGVSLRHFDPRKWEDDAMELRRRLGLDDKFVIMYHGVLRPGLENAIDAIAKLKGIRDDVVLFILGAGPGEDIMKSHAAKLGGSVRFHSSVSYEELPKFIGACDVGIVPLDSGYWHSSPLKLLEYLAMEKPVIATDLPFNREVFALGDCGLLVKSNAIDDLALAITEMSQKKMEVLIRIGHVGRTIVERQYSWESKAGDLERFVKTL